MAAISMEELLVQFEQNWFKENIIFPKIPDKQNSEKCHEPMKISSTSSQLLVRSFSKQLLSSTEDSFSSKGNGSPNSVLPMTSKQLQTIFSGKEFEEFDVKKQRQKQGRENRGSEVKRRKRRNKEGKSKSLSELEFEELKGFMDLGFVFSEEDKDSSLVSIIPGLQRLGEKQGNVCENNCEYHDNECNVSRPYLSESWEMLDQRKEVNNPLVTWKIPSDLVSNEVDMKNHLRFWAHAVASTVR